MKPTAPKKESRNKGSILEKKFLQFYSKSKWLSVQDEMKLRIPANIAQMLSNFYVQPIEYNGKMYASVENVYQGMKYSFIKVGDLDKIKDIQLKFQLGNEYGTPDRAKTEGGKGAMKRHKVELDIVRWNKASMELMTALIVLKVKNNNDIQHALDVFNDNGINLLHHSRSDMLWGCHNDAEGNITTDQKTGKTGKNLLGHIYMTIGKERAANAAKAKADAAARDANYELEKTVKIMDDASKKPKPKKQLRFYEKKSVVRKRLRKAEATNKKIKERKSKKLAKKLSRKSATKNKVL